MNICVYGAASKNIDPKYTDAGYDLGLKLAKRGHGLVFGGGNGGMMGAVARGAHDGGAHIIGIAPSFFNIDGVLYPHSDEIIYTETTRQRQQKSELKTGALSVTPGLIATFEEFLDILTQKQRARTDKPLVILNTAGYYDSMLMMMRHSIENNFLTASTMGLIFVADTPDEALDYITDYRSQEVDIKKLRNVE